MMADKREVPGMQERDLKDPKNSVVIRDDE